MNPHIVVDRTDRDPRAAIDREDKRLFDCAARILARGADAVEIIKARMAKDEADGHGPASPR